MNKKVLTATITATAGVYASEYFQASAWGAASESSN